MRRSQLNQDLGMAIDLWVWEAPEASARVQRLLGLTHLILV